MNKYTKSIIFWTIAAIVIAGSVFIVIQGAEPSPYSGGDVRVDEITEADWSKGNPDAKVTFIEYSDFQCPACVLFASLTEDMMKEYGNHVNFAYRHFPLKSIHPNAMPAARAANAAGQQGQFFEMHNLLFLNKDRWGNENIEEAEASFFELADALKLDSKKFYEDYNSEDNIQSVENDYNNAVKAGLTYTPSFFLNGELIRMPQNKEAFNKIIRDAVEAAE